MIEIPKIEMYNRDCMKLMQEYEDNHFDLAIVDPPYGNKGYDSINKKSSRNQYKAKRKAYKTFDNSKPSNSYFLELKRVSRNQIVWGGNFFGLSGGVIAWNKNGTAFGEGEVAICSTHKSVRFYEFTWNGMLQGDMKNKEVRIHPTQKPVALYKWLLQNYAKPGDKILDTHGGSGSICIACHDMKYDLVWTELDKDYYEAATKRFKQHTAQLQIF